ncbi:hypothetical protein OIU77_030653, partial [Salix suchowensis]
MYLFLLLSSSKTGVHGRYPSNEAYCEKCGTACGHFCLLDWALATTVISMLPCLVQLHNLLFIWMFII